MHAYQALGWQVCHMPKMTIVHHAGKAGVRPQMVAQDAYSASNTRASTWGYAP